jgi:hypothetical protein
MTWPVGVGLTSPGPTGADFFMEEFHGDGFGLKLGTLVMAGQLALGGGIGFGSGNDRAIVAGRQSDAADGAGVNNPGAASLSGGFQDVAGAFDVVGVHGRVIAHPEVIAGGDVKAPIAAGNFAFEQGAVGEVAGDALNVLAGQHTIPGAGAHERFDAMTARKQFVHEIGANKPAGAGDKAFHGLDLDQPSNT